MKNRKMPSRHRTSRAVTAVAVIGALAAASPVLAGGTENQAASKATRAARQNLRALDRLSTEVQHGLVPLTDAQLAQVEGTNHPAQAYFGLTTAALNRPAFPEVPGIAANHNETLLRDEG